MRIALILSIVLLFSCIALTPANAENPYPEYYPGHPLPSSQYTQPDFHGNNCYWIRYWNASGYQACDDPDTTGHEWAVAKDDWDGVAYDGRLLVNPRIEGEKVFFAYENSGRPRDRRYFYRSQLVDDPRLTNWWMAFASDSAGTLWQAVERAALSQDHPEVTQAIINDITAWGIVNELELNHMSPSYIRWVMLTYTDQALNYNLARTREAVGQPLTRNDFERAKAGDTISSYYIYRYGPVPLTWSTYVICGHRGDSLLVRRDCDENEMSWAWNDIQDLAQYMTLRKP